MLIVWKEYQIKNNTISNINTKLILVELFTFDIITWRKFLKLSNFICSINFLILFRYKYWNDLVFTTFCLYFLAKTSSQKDAVLDKETPRSALEEAIDLLVKCDAIVGKNYLYLINILALKITDIVHIMCL